MTIPFCHKCADAELKPFIMAGVTVFHMVGCKSCDAKSYDEARVMCPLINEDAKNEFVESELNDA